MIGVLTLIPAIVFIALGATSELTVLLIIGIVVFVVAVFFFGRASAEAAKFKKIIKRELIHALLAEEFDDVIYDQIIHPSSRINEQVRLKN